MRIFGGIFYFMKTNFIKAKSIENWSKQIEAIQSLIDSNQIIIDFLEAKVVIENKTFMQYRHTLQTDEQNDKLFNGFCVMIRTWINFQRAFKKGSLEKITDENSNIKIKINPENLNSLQDDEILSFVVIGTNQTPILFVEQIQKGFIVRILEVPKQSR